LCSRSCALLVEDDLLTLNRLVLDDLLNAGLSSFFFVGTSPPL
jgi:hypothetical protein